MPPISAIGETAIGETGSETGRVYPFAIISNSNRRHKRDDDSVNSTDSLEYIIYIGVGFDGFQKYDNLSSALPDQTVVFFWAPTIGRPLGTTFTFEPSDLYLHIKVSL